MQRWWLCSPIQREDDDDDDDDDGTCASCSLSPNHPPHWKRPRPRQRRQQTQKWPQAARNSLVVDPTLWSLDSNWKIRCFVVGVCLAKVTQPLKSFIHPWSLQQRLPLWEHIKEWHLCPLDLFIRPPQAKLSPENLFPSFPWSCTSSSTRVLVLFQNYTSNTNYLKSIVSQDFYDILTKLVKIQIFIKGSKSYLAVSTMTKQEKKDRLLKEVDPLTRTSPFQSWNLRSLRLSLPSRYIPDPTLKEGQVVKMQNLRLFVKIILVASSTCTSETG